MGEQYNPYKLNSAEEIDSKAEDLYTTHKEQSTIIEATEDNPKAMKKVEADNNMREREVAKMNKIEAGMSSVALANVYGTSPDHPRTDGKTLKDRVDLARRELARKKLRADRDPVVDKYAYAGALHKLNLDSAKGYVAANPEIVEIAHDQMEADLAARAESTGDK